MIPHLRRFRLGIDWGMVLVAVAGCGRSLPPCAPVSGRITLAGKPLAGAAISFVSDAAPRFGLGRTDEAGNYSLTTFRSGDGAVVGEHRVVVLPSPRVVAAESGDPNALPTADTYRRLEQARVGGGNAAIPPAYRAADSTPLRAVVKPGVNRFDFDVKPR